MLDKIKRYNLFILTSFAATVALCVARLMLILNNIEMDSLENSAGLYYLDGSNAPVIFAVVCVVVGVLFVAGTVYFTKEITASEGIDSPSVHFTSAINGLTLAAITLYFSYLLLFEKGSFSYELLAITLLTAISAAYFLLISSRRASKRFKTLVTVLSMVPAVLTAIRLLLDFIARSLTVSASSYSYHLVGLAFLMMFLCCEGRFNVGYRRKGLYVALGLITAMLLTVYSVPALYLSLFWPLEFTDVTIYCVADVVMALYIYCRLLSVPKREEALAE